MLFFISFFFFSFVLLINRHFSQFMNDHQIIHTHFLFLAGANVMAIKYKQTKVKAKYVLMSKTPQADGNRYMLSFQNICTCSNACKEFFFFASTTIPVGHVNTVENTYACTHLYLWGPWLKCIVCNLDVLFAKTLTNSIFSVHTLC